jgi:hypothetical protein
MNSDQEPARAIALEKFKFDRSKELEDHKAIEARHQISFKATLDFGTMACRSVLLINGAGAIALMTFIGHQDKMIAAGHFTRLLSPPIASAATNEKPTRA